jgi:hypothetical protein
VRNTEAQVAALAADVRRAVAIVRGAVAREVVVVMLLHPVPVVEEVAVLRAARRTSADLVVVDAMLTVGIAERRSAIDALPGRRAIALPASKERTFTM